MIQLVILSETIRERLCKLLKSTVEGLHKTASVTEKSEPLSLESRIYVLIHQVFS